jgi:hypothetical protein
VSQGVYSLVVVAEDRQIITVLEILLYSTATLVGVDARVWQTPGFKLDEVYLAYPSPRGVML